MAQVNTDNFLLWYDSTPTVGLPGMPWQYHIDRGRCGSLPIAVATEGVGFYVNNLTGIFDETVDVDDLGLNIVNAYTGATVATGIEDIEKHVVSGDPDAEHQWNPWAIAIWPALPDGMYRLQIVDTSADPDAVLLTSSPVLYVSDQEFIDEHTTYCRFKHDRYFYGIQYDEVPGFYNQFRLIMGKVDVQPESEKEVYREATTGKRRTYQNYLDKMVKIETYYMTEEQHIAAAIMCEMDYLELNQKRYRLKATYRIETDIISKISKGAAELFEEDFSSANRC